jgi:hypothetical protein
VDLDAKVGGESKTVIDGYELALEHVGGVRVRGGSTRGNVFLVRAIFHGFKELDGQVLELLSGGRGEFLGNGRRGRGS